LVALQNLADLENIQCLCSEVCPASSHDAYQAISIQSEILSYAEEEYPVPITLSGIKPESKASCVHVRWISQLQIFRFTNFATANNFDS
jgi:hypothetical protein